MPKIQTGIFPSKDLFVPIKTLLGLL